MVDPKIMRALIWHRSGGEPWSFLPGERRPEVYRTVGDAIGAAHATYPDSIRAGLTGLPAYLSIRDRGDVRPVSELALAARQIRDSPSAAWPPAFEK